MVNHTSASTREETPQVIETTRIAISQALRRRAQSVINDRSIDPRWRVVIRYGLETNDPWLADLVRPADAHERIIDAIDFSQPAEADQVDSSEEKIAALAEMSCRGSDESAAALLVLLATLENSKQPKVLANTAKHYAFTRCSELNLFGMVDAQIALVEKKLFLGDTLSPDGC